MSVVLGFFINCVILFNAKTLPILCILC